MRTTKADKLKNNALNETSVDSQPVDLRNALAATTAKTRALKYLDKFDLIVKCPDRVYRYGNRQLIAQNSGYHPNDWTILTKENHKGEMTALGARQGRPAYLPIGDLQLMFREADYHEELLEMQATSSRGLNDKVKGHIDNLNGLTSKKMMDDKFAQEIASDNELGQRGLVQDF